jgi:hypothetical protein
MITPPDNAISMNPLAVGPASNATSRQSPRAGSTTVGGHPQLNPRSSPGVSSGYIDNIPHAPGSTACLCSSCHLKTRLFPRTQHGRILLPDPSKHDSMTHFMTAMGPPRSHVPNATAAIAMPSIVSEERGEPIPRPAQLNKEAASAGWNQLSGMHFLCSRYAKDVYWMVLGHQGPDVASIRDEWTRPSLPPLRDFGVPGEVISFALSELLSSRSLHEAFGMDSIIFQHSIPRIARSQRNRSLTTQRNSHSTTSISIRSRSDIQLEGMQGPLKVRNRMALTSQVGNGISRSMLYADQSVPSLSSGMISSRFYSTS